MKTALEFWTSPKMMQIKRSVIMHYALIIMNYYLGGLAQLARAPALQAGGQRFESVILHTSDKRRL